MKKSALKEEQWAKIAPLLPEPKRSSKGGRPPAANLPCFEGILWVLRSGARWKDLPKEYPSYSTCRRRLLEWEDAGVWLAAWRALLGELDELQRLDLEECFADGSFAPAKKGGSASEKPNAERVQSGWWLQAAREFLWQPTSTRRRRAK